MRVFTGESYEDRGADAMLHNPGNLYFTFSVEEPLPLVCPFTDEQVKDSRADYVVCGPQGWTLVRDYSSGRMQVMLGPIPAKAIWK